MKLTNATIYDIIGAVNKFNNAKGKTAFILFRTLRKLNEEIKDCDEQKNKLIQKYGKEVEGGGIAIPRDDAEATKNFMEEFTPSYSVQLMLIFHSSPKRNLMIWKMLMLLMQD